MKTCIYMAWLPPLVQPVYFCSDTSKAMARSQRTQMDAARRVAMATSR